MQNKKNSKCDHMKKKSQTNRQTDIQTHKQRQIKTFDFQFKIFNQSLLFINISIKINQE